MTSNIRYPQEDSAKSSETDLRDHIHDGNENHGVLFGDV